MAAFIKNKFTMEAETINFNRHIRDFIKKSSLSTDVILKKFAFDLVSRIIMKSPVDTGRSRAAWYVSAEKLGSGNRISSLGARAVKRGQKKGGNRYGMNNALQLGRSEGKCNIHLGRLVQKKYIEIINGVKYILFLEYGRSKQAPQGMVRISMREMTGSTLPKELALDLKKDWNKFYYTRGIV